MIFRTGASTTHAGGAVEAASRRTAFDYCRRLVFFLLLSINICPVQVSSIGVFQIKFTSLANDEGRDIHGRCCSGGGGGGRDGGGAVPRVETDANGGGGIDAEDVCSGPCRTFFTVCLRQFQRDLPTGDVECTLGEATTEAKALNSFNESDESVNYNSVSIPFDYQWRNSSSLFVKVWHDTTGVGPSKDSDRTLIAEFAFARENLTVNATWHREVNSAGRIRIGYGYRAVCNKHYFGPGCSVWCQRRDDKHGHYNCSEDDGSKRCLPGWTGGEYCLTAICLDGCNTTNGYCEEPFECKCRSGWKGDLCNECMPHPKCTHGGCNDKYQCNCFEGWGGEHCNEDLNYCTNHKPCKNGATCTNTGKGSFTCVCLPGFTGERCDTEIFDCHKNVCVNGGVCKQQSDGQGICQCRDGFSGRRCETNPGNCRENPCKNLGTCRPLGDDLGYRCHCPPGFTGENCDLDVVLDKCASAPCVNGGRCINEDGGYRCSCAPGFTGLDCSGRIDDDCRSRPCVWGTCLLDPTSGYRCLCDVGFTGADCDAKTFDGGQETLNESTTMLSPDDYVSPESDVPPTDSYLRQVMLVVCLGLLLLLLIVCAAVVVFVLHRRRRRCHRRRRHHQTPSNDWKQKMNNVTEEEECYYETPKSKGAAGGHPDVINSQHHHLHQQHRRPEFAVREPVKIQRNINDANNLRNVEKCSNRKQKVLDWNASLESNATKSIDHDDGPESKTNVDRTNEANVWKEKYDGTLSKRSPSNIISGSQVYSRPEPMVINDSSIATEV